MLRKLEKQEVNLYFKFSTFKVLDEHIKNALGITLDATETTVTEDPTLVGFFRRIKEKALLLFKKLKTRVLPKRLQECVADNTEFRNYSEIQRMRDENYMIYLKSINMTSDQLLALKQIQFDHNGDMVCVHMTNWTLAHLIASCHKTQEKLAKIVDTPGIRKLMDIYTEILGILNHGYHIANGSAFCEAHFDIAEKIVYIDQPPMEAPEQEKPKRTPRIIPHKILMRSAVDSSVNTIDCLTSIFSRAEDDEKGAIHVYCTYEVNRRVLIQRVTHIKSHNDNNTGNGQVTGYPRPNIISCSGRGYPPYWKFFEGLSEKIKKLLDLPYNIPIYTEAATI